MSSTSGSSTSAPNMQNKGALHEQLQRGISHEDRVRSKDNEQTQLPVKKISTRLSLPGSPPTDHAIRSRFFSRLGIRTNKVRPSAPPAKRAPSRSFCESLKADSGKPDPTLLPHHDKDEEDDGTHGTMESSSLDSYHSRQPLPPNSSPSSSSGSIGIRSVSFRSTVTVHPIPARSAYSDRIRQQLWTPVEVREHNAARNIYEFAAEDWDWTKVVDDEYFIHWNGERIHPIHLQQCNLNNHFLSVMSQR